jgi:hypothetical protein
MNFGGIINYMKKIIRFLFILLFISFNIYSKGLTESKAKLFINALINKSDNLNNFVLPEELKLSERLGITYKQTKFKYLISNNINDSVLIKLRKKSLKYAFKIEPLKKNYSILKFQVPSKNIERDYYFYKSYLISRPYYYSRNWAIKKSDFFEFHVSDAISFNEYSIKKLDSFVKKMTKLLGFNKDEISLLKQEKIHYFLCKDENEIKKLTGYNARGLYFLPYDYIVTTFNCHYHEILHLLMNFKLKDVPLFTLPLLQEGFAVAYGGRGGRTPSVILKIGLFLLQSNFIKVSSLFTKRGFYQNDASITYPVSGLYVKFLFKTMGINRFIKLYKKYSGKAENINELKINTTELPPETKWKEYLNNYRSNRQVRISGINAKNYQDIIIRTKNFCVYENNQAYLFKIRNAITLTPENSLQNYVSGLFNELYAGKIYQNEEYILSADSNEISLYNLYSNNLIVKYVKAFSLKKETITRKNGYFIFVIVKKVFDKELCDYSISNL